MSDSQQPGSVARVSPELVTLALCCVAALATGLVMQPRHVASPNEMSRWATVRALVENHTFAVGARETTGTGFRDTGIISETAWTTVDVVLRPDTQTFYSSKPPLLQVLVAAEVWVLSLVLGWSMTWPARAVVTTVLLTFNVAAFVAFLWLLLRWAQARGASLWSLAFAFMAAAAGTYLIAFLVTLNGHTPAAFLSFASLYWLDRVWRGDGGRAAWWCGGTSALAAAMEPTAILGVGVVGVLAVLRDHRLLWRFTAAAVAVAAVALGLNWLAVGSPLGAYSHGDWYTYPGSYWLNPSLTDLEDVTVNSYVFHLTLGHRGFFSLCPVLVLGVAALARPLERQDHFLWGATLLLFSVAPIVVARLLHVQAAAPLWVCVAPAGVAGAAAVFLPWRWWQHPDAQHQVHARAMAALWVMLVSLVVASTDTWGGVTITSRHLLWLVPGWIMLVLDACNSHQHRRGFRPLAMVLLAVSITLVVLTWRTGPVSPRPGVVA